MHVDDGPALTILGDETQLEQVFINVLLNSIAATPAGGTITVRAETTNDGARLQVTDTGRGMDDDALATAFDPYVSGRTGGHGLGLAIVRRIAEQHGWKVSLQSAVNAGTTIVFEQVALASSAPSATP